jgi:predicted nucleotidyltransferase
MPDPKPTSTASKGLLNADVLQNVRTASAKKRQDLDAVLSEGMGKYANEDTSLVVFGSLARDEWTSGSDLDWTFLINSAANPEHLNIAQDIRRILKETRKNFLLPAPPALSEIWRSATISSTTSADRTIPTGTHLSESCCCSNRALLAKEWKPMIA